VEKAGGRCGGEEGGLERTVEREAQWREGDGGGTVEKAGRMHGGAQLQARSIMVSFFSFLKKIW
jgi:hypothetical protein